MRKKNFAELELSLLHLQRNVEIPETHLIIHPVIQRAVEQVCPPHILTLLRTDVHRLKHPIHAQIYHTFHQSFSTTARFLTLFTDTLIHGSSLSKQSPS